VRYGVLTAPAWAHGALESSAPAPVWQVALRAAVLLTTAVVAGTGLLRAFGPETTASWRRAVFASAVVAAVAAVVAIPSYGAWPVIALPQALATLAVVRSLHRRVFATTAGSLLTALLAYEAAAAHRGAAAVAIVVHTASASVWCAAALGVAASGSAWRSTLRRLSVPAVVCGALVAGSGVVQAAGDHVSVAPGSWQTAFPRIVVLKALLLVAAVALALVARRGLAVVGMRAEALLLAVAVVLGASLAVLPAPPAPGRPLLRRVTLAGTPVSVLVAPQQPGWNLVRLSSDGDVMVNGQPADAAPGATGRWARVWLPRGRSAVTLTTGAAHTTLHLDSGSEAAAPAFSGADAVECVEASLALITGVRRLTACPSDALTAADAVALAQTVRFLGRHGASRIRVVADTSPRSMAASRVVRTAAADAGLAVVTQRADSTVVVGGWSTAQAELSRLRGKVAPLHGVYLSPWLLTAPLLTDASSVATLLALPFDPRSTAATTYAARLARLVPGATPTESGWETYARLTRPASVRLYASALVSILPASLGHAHDDSGWLPGGTLTAVSARLDVA
jgi:hypothetical protein